VDSNTGRTVYSGTDGPDSVEASALMWISDDDNEWGGFKICFTPTPPSPPSPPALPPSPPSPPSSPPSPPSPPLQPGSRYAYSANELVTALGDSAVSRIVLIAGTYEFVDDMCPDSGGSALCMDRTVTIEAEVAGSVVLDAKGARRVIYVSPNGRAELVGLNITGGIAYNVSCLASIEPTFHCRLLILTPSYTGWWHPHRWLCRSD